MREFVFKPIELKYESVPAFPFRGMGICDKPRSHEGKCFRDDLFLNGVT
jgi:hypothetical protein